MSILVAGIGNIFNGDDAFGVEVVHRLARRPQPAGVTVIDFGIRGLELTYALTSGYGAVILIDAAMRGHPPGVVTVVKPEAPHPDDLAPEDLIISAHDLDPAKVLKLVASLGGGCDCIVLVACEPQDCGGEVGIMGLSPVVAAAVAPAIATVEDLIATLLMQQQAGDHDHENA